MKWGIAITLTVHLMVIRQRNDMFQSTRHLCELDDVAPPTLVLTPTAAPAPASASSTVSSVRKADGV